VAEIVKSWKSYTCFSADYLNEWIFLQPLGAHWARPKWKPNRTN